MDFEEKYDSEIIEREVAQILKLQKLLHWNYFMQKENRYTILWKVTFYVNPLI